MKADDLDVRARVARTNRYALVDELVAEFDHDRAQPETLSLEVLAEMLDREYRRLMRAPRRAA